jgi:hypothetical protein
VVVIVWKMDLPLPVQSMLITTKAMSSNVVHGEVYSIQHYVIMFVSVNVNEKETVVATLTW